MQDTVLEMDTGGEVEGAKHKIRSLLSGAHDAAGEIRPHTGKITVIFSPAFSSRPREKEPGIFKKTMETGCNASLASAEFESLKRGGVGAVGAQ